METEVLIEKNENQISFDFLQTPEVENVTSAQNFEWVAEETLVVLVRSKGAISADFDLCGKKFVEWVSLATASCEQTIIEEPEEESLLEEINKISDGYRFVAVFYSDTPLLKRSTFLEIMDFFSKMKMNVLKLERGYIFKKDYLQVSKMILSSNVERFGEEDFVVVNNASMINYAFKVMNERILNYHKQNGVVLLGENTIFIDADVEIESGTVIYPNNIIKGESYIGQNVILESGNYILDTIVCEDAFVCQSYVEKSKIEKGKIVGPFARLVKQKV